MTRKKTLIIVAVLLVLVALTVVGLVYRSSKATSERITYYDKNGSKALFKDCE